MRLVIASTATICWGHTGNAVVGSSSMGMTAVTMVSRQNSNWTRRVRLPGVEATLPRTARRTDPRRADTHHEMSRSNPTKRPRTQCPAAHASLPPALLLPGGRDIFRSTRAGPTTRCIIAERNAEHTCRLAPGARPAPIRRATPRLTELRTPALDGDVACGR